MPATMAIRGVYPWRSVDAVDEAAEMAGLPVTPEHDIDVCLRCERCAEACDRCDGRGNLRREATGRPRARINFSLLSELMRMRQTNRQMCAALNVSHNTLIKAKKEITRHYDF